MACCPIAVELMPRASAAAPKAILPLFEETDSLPMAMESMPLALALVPMA